MPNSVPIAAPLVSHFLPLALHAQEEPRDHQGAPGQVPVLSQREQGRDILISRDVLLSLYDTVRQKFMNVDTLLHQYFPLAENVCIEMFDDRNIQQVYRRLPAIS